MYIRYRTIPTAVCRQHVVTVWTHDHCILDILQNITGPFIN